jgi:4-amino-4-deoxy-L-arabinose transferase-like glycosyltransferase
MNTPYQKIFIGLLVLLSSLLLVLSIKNSIPLAIIFNSIFILFTILYILTNQDKFKKPTHYLNSRWINNAIQKIQEWDYCFPSMLLCVLFLSSIINVLTSSELLKTFSEILFVLSIILFLYLLNKRPKEISNPKDITTLATTKKPLTWIRRNYKMITLILIIIVGFSNIFLNLEKLPLHQDEQYHFETAYGYKETGNFVKWNFLYNTPEKNYERNIIYTYLVHISNETFGWSETSSRLVSAIIGFFGLFLIFFVTKRIFNSNIALLSAYIYSVNDAIIYFSRFVRGYIFIMVASIIVFYLSYRLSQEKNWYKGSFYIILLLLLFFIGLTFHPTFILLLPTTLMSVGIYIFKNISVKKEILIVGLLFSIIGIITLFLTKPISFGITNHIATNINWLQYDLSYLKHITNPYNLPYFFFILLPIFSIVSIVRKYHFYKVHTLLLPGVIVPLLLSLYLFDRYEDFRYIAVLQPIFIIYISMLLYSIFGFLKNKKNSTNILTLILLLITTISFQAPYFPRIPFLTKTSQANWENIEGARIHRRTAVPESIKAFDYMFSQNDEELIIVRLEDSGIGWSDTYYLKQYSKKYPDKKITFYRENAYYSGSFDEIYSWNKNYDLLDKNIPYAELVFKKDTYVIGNLRHLTNKKLMILLDTSCTNIAKDIGIVRYSYFISYQEYQNNYFPNVFICNSTQVFK